jgi:hypothetical protein
MRNGEVESTRVRNPALVSQPLITEAGYISPRRVIASVALYLNRGLWPFTALNSWTGGLATGLNS